ncbi:variable surface protein [Plasmodium gonderi]|uniref:Variable surface protein n=1 Tax=Plasmodium gonderi TaxID=77519 RepID=A0A1Y1JTA9_PLAGO|nr:variable surface protein [Plasmodium gonderi]GAW84012.1 variable surface protein [Plasmodium gonderi]
MVNSIYEIIKYFPQCKNKLDYYISQGEASYWKKKCAHNKYNQLKDGVPDYDNKCQYVMQYLVDVNSNVVDGIKESGLEYFYYWIYDSVLGKNVKRIDDIQNIYDQFIHVYQEEVPDRKGINRDLFENKKIHMKDVDFPKLAATYDMFMYIKDKNSNNGNYSEDNILKKIEELVKQYISQMDTSSSVIQLPEVLQPCKRNIIIPIISTILVMLLTSIFLFSLYKHKKFTTFRSWIRYVMGKKVNSWNDIDEEDNRYHGSEIFSTMSRHNTHNMLYQ